MTAAATDAPADTSVMRIVHNALRRDLDRVSGVLTGDHGLPDDQRRALADHLMWLMGFLHAHHSGEDEGLFPAVRERRPDAADVLDEMDRDHHEISPAVDRLQSAAGSYRENGDAGSREAVGAAVDELRCLLEPHLEKEEEALLPIVSQCLTHREWTAIEQEHFVRTKSMRELGLEGHWLIDDVGEQDRAIVLAVVAPVPRFVLLHGFARTYRRRRDRWWRPERLRRRIPHQASVGVEVNVPLDAVWEVVRDPTRVGEWSHECVGAEYLEGANAATAGVRFRGRNRQGVFRWGRICEVVSVEPHELVWRTVPTRLTPDSSLWTIRLEPTAEGTRIEQRYEIVKGAGPLEAVYATILPGHRDRAAALEADLRRLGDVAGSVRRGSLDQQPSA